MAIGSSGQPTVEVHIDADADAAAAEIEAKFRKAIVDALNSPQGKVAIDTMIKSFTKSMKAFTKSSDDAFKKTTAAGKKAASEIGKAFADVGNKSKEALSFNAAHGGSRELQALNAHVAALAHNMDSLAGSSKQTLRLIQEQGTAARAQVRSFDQSERTKQAQIEATQRLHSSTMQREAAEIKANAAVRVATIRSATRLIITLEQSIGRAISTTWKAASTAVSGFARGAAGILRGFASTTHSIFSGITRAISTGFSGGTKVISGFARGATSIISGFARGVAKAFTGMFSGFRGLLHRQESDLSSSLRRQQAQVRNAQSGIRGGVLGRAALIGGGALTVGSILGGGLERFSNIETLQFRFERMLGSADKARALIQEISDFARTTSFDLPGLAGLASNFLAMGMSADEATVNIERLADVTAFAGGNTDSLERIQRALGQIISTGKLQGDELNQLAENLPGINIRQIIADQLGVTTEELVKMQENGEISADAFINAFLNGVDDPRYRGAAVAIAQTLTGRLANLKESVDIFGASIIGLISGPMGSAMTKVTSFLQGFGNFIQGKQEGPATLVEVSKGVFEFQNALVDLEGPLKTVREVLGNMLKTVGGLLAFKGVVEVFQLLRKVLHGFFITKTGGLNPFSILAVSVLGVVGAFTLFNKFSAKFAYRFQAVTANIKPTIDAVVRLGKAFVGAFSMGGEGGVAGVIGKIGDAFAFVGDVLVRVMSGIFHFSDELANLLEIRGFKDFGDSLDRAFAGAVAGLFNLSSEQWQQARDQAGSEFLNILEMTFLAPVVRFMRGPFLTGVKAVINAVSNAVGSIVDFAQGIWKRIFGGGDEATGPGGFFRSMEEQMSGTDSERRSLGTRILDNLENTFIGPVIRFFRGPVADAVESIGGFFGGLFDAIFHPAGGVGIATSVADFLETTFLGPIVRFFREGHFGEMLTNVKDFFTPAFTAIGDAVTGLWDAISPIIKPLIDSIKNLIDAFKDWDFSNIDLGNVALAAAGGGIAGLVVGGIPGLVIGAIAGALTQTGIFSGIIDSIKNVWTMAIEPALVDLWDKIRTRITELFTAENLGKAAHFILDMLYAAGKLVGTIATDPIFIGAIAGIAAAGVLVVGQFTLGLVTGIAASLIQWANLISDGLESAWNAIAPNFLPDPITNAIAGALGSPVAGLVAGVGAAVIGTMVVKAVIGGITQIGPALVQGAGGLVGMIFGKQKLGADGLPAKAESAFTSLGAKIAGAVIGGIVSFKIGEAAGKTGGTGNLILALLSGAAVGATLGTAIAPGFGTAIGAALGAAAAGIGAYFGTAARKAQEARNEVAEYADALMGLSSADFAPAAGDIVLLNLGEQRQAVQDFFILAGFDAADWAQKVIDGNAEVGQSFSDLFDGILQSDAFAQLSTEQQQALRQYADDINFALSQDLSMPFPQTDAAKEALAALGIDTDTLALSYQLLNTEQGDLASGLEDIGRQTALRELSGQADDAAESLFTMDDAVAAIVDHFRGGGRLAGAEGILNFGGFDTTEKIQIMEQVARELETALNDARTAAVDLLTGPAAQSLEDSLRDFRLSIASTADGLAEAFSHGVSSDQFQNALDEVRDDIANALSQGFTDGTIDSQGEFDSFIQGLRDGIENSNVDDEVKAQLQAVVDEFAAQGLSAFDTIFDATRDQAIVVAYAARLAGDFQGAWNAALAAARQAPHTGTTFGQFVQTSIDAASILSGSPTQGTVDSLASGINVSGFRIPGGDAMSEFTGGFDDKESEGKTAVKNTVEKIADSVTSAKGTSMKNAGRDIADQFRGGIEDGGPGAVFAGAQLGYSAISGAGAFAGQMYLIGANLANAMARGIRDATTAAALAAVAMAAAVVAAARARLKIFSPSVVFRDIGKQIGAGFVLGIQDSETTMADAIATAITNAVSTAVEKAGKAIAKSQAASAIFSLLAPSTLPGGTSTAEIMAQRLALTQSIQGFAPGLRSGASEAFGATGSIDRFGATEAVKNIAFTFRNSFLDVKEQLADALAQQKEIKTFNDALAKINAQRTSGELGAIRRARETAELNAKMAESEKDRADEIRKLKVQLDLGKTTLDEYNQRIFEINSEFAATTLADYQAELAKINAAYKNGTLNAEEFRDALDKLGDRPAGLTREQQSLIASGASSLTIGTIAGNANREAIAGALGDIRAFGQELLDAGVAIPEVIRQMSVYRDQLIKQATSFGFNRAELDKIIAAYGLTNAQMAAFREQLLSLNPATATGASNIADILSQLQEIFSFGEALVGSGTSAEAAVAEIKKMRDQLIKAALAFGFNAAAIQALVTQVGLSDSALVDFIAQLKAYEAAVAAGQVPTVPGGSAGIEQPIVYQTIHLNVPYGDPESVGLSVANRTAYELARSF